MHFWSRILVNAAIFLALAGFFQKLPVRLLRFRRGDRPVGQLRFSAVKCRGEADSLHFVATNHDSNVGAVQHRFERRNAGADVLLCGGQLRV